MNKLVTVWNYICKYKCQITLITFGAFIGFLDENSLVRRIRYEREISALKSEIEKYRVEYDENTRQLNELNSDPESIEQIAREKYLMKKPNEDIYVFDEKK